MHTTRLAPYAVDSLPPMPPFPVDPAALRRAWHVDARIVADLGFVKGIEVATSADAAARRASLMLGARDEDGRYVHTGQQVFDALAAWHADHRYPAWSGVRRG